MAGLTWLGVRNVMYHKEKALSEALSLSRAFSDDFYAIDRMQEQDSAVRMASRLSLFSDLLYLEAVRQDGETIFRHRRPDWTPAPALLDVFPDQEEGLAHHDGMFFIRVPIQHNSTTWGGLYLIQHSGDLLNIKMILPSLIYVLFWTAVLGFYWNWWTDRRLVQPILKLGNLLSRVQRTRDFSVRADPDLNDEIGTLQRGINSFLNALEVYQQEIQDKQEALTIQQGYLHSTVQTATIGMALYDSRRQLILSNATFSRLLFVLDESSDESTAALIERVLDEVEIMHEVCTSDGQTLRLVGIPTVDQGGFVITVRDVTSEIKASRELLARSQSHKMEAIGRLAGSVAHDFNNLLAVILPISESLLETVEDPDNQEDVQAIYDASIHAAELTSTLLSFTRSSQITEEVFDLVTLIRGLEQVLYRVVSEGQNLSIELSSRPVQIAGNPASLKQVLMNLLFNAVDATSSEDFIYIKVNSEVLEEGDPRLGPLSPGPAAIFLLADTGVGMSPEIIARIFEPYYTTRASGTGLGLATVYQVVTQSRGHIHIDSEPGKGTTFTIVLPLQEASQEATKPLTIIQSQGGGDRILLVDDNPLVLRTLGRSLHRAGFSVTALQDPEAAVRVLTEEPSRFDLLLTDIRMPGMSGPEMVRRVEAIRGSMLPFLYISGHIDDDTAQRYRLSEERLLLKPFHVSDLIERLQQLEPQLVTVLEKKEPQPDALQARKVTGL